MRADSEYSGSYARAGGEGSSVPAGCTPEWVVRPYGVLRRFCYIKFASDMGNIRAPTCREALYTVSHSLYSLMALA